MPEKTPNQDANGASLPQSSEAKPLSDQDLEALAGDVLETPDKASVANDVVDAEAVVDSEAVAAQDADIVEAEVVDERSYMDAPPRAYAVAAGPVNFNQRKLQTKGGAVGGAILGALSIMGAFLTSYSSINAFVGLVLSVWGLNSGSNRLATAGLVLSLIGLVLSIALGITR